MSTQLIQSAFPTFVDLDGSLLENGYIYIGTYGDNPVDSSNQITVYYDKDLQTQASQPIRTVDGYPSRGGSPAQLYAAVKYSIVVQNSNEELIYSSLSPIAQITSDDLPWYNVLDYGDGTFTEETLSAAITALGSSDNYTLLIKTGTWVINSNLSIPANVELLFEQDAILSISTGITVTYNGPDIKAPVSQIFSLAGTGVFVFAKSTVVYPEWWGAVADGTTDCAPAMQDAIDTLNTGVGGEVRLQPRVYKMDTTPGSASKTTLLAKSNVHIHCPSGKKAEFDFDGLLNPNVINYGIYATGISYFKLTGVKLSADVATFTNDGFQLVGLKLESSTNCVIDECEVTEFEDGILFMDGCADCTLSNTVAFDCRYHSLGAWATSSSTPCERLTFVNLYGYSTSSVEKNVPVSGFYMEETYDSSAVNIKAKNCSDGIRVENCCDNNLTNLKAWECWGAGLTMYNQTQRNNVSNVSVFDNNKANHDAIDSTIRGNDNTQMSGVNIENQSQNNNLVNIQAFQTHAGEIPFNSGSDESTLGSKLEGTTSAATGRVRRIDLTSGSWAGNDAAGTFHVVEASGTFNGSEVIKNVTTIVPFNSGSDKPDVNDVITQDVSGASGTLLWVSNQGGTGDDWDLNAANGFMYLTGVTGTFDATNNLNNTTTSSSNIATANAASTAEDTDIATMNGSYVGPAGSNKGFQKYGVGIIIRNLAGLDTADAYNNIVSAQCFNNDLNGYEDRGFYDVPTSINEDFNTSAFVRNA